MDVLIGLEQRITASRNRLLELEEVVVPRTTKFPPRRNIFSGLLLPEENAVRSLPMTWGLQVEQVPSRCDLMYEGR